MTQFGLPILAALFALVSACAPEQVGESLVEVPPEPPAITLRAVDFVHSRGSKVFAEGHAEAVRFLRDTGETEATIVRVRFPRPDSPGSATEIRAPRATGNPLESRVTGAGGVLFRDEKGARGETAEASYDGARAEAWSTKPVSLLGQGYVLDSPGFRWRAGDDRLDLGPTRVVTTGRP